MDRLLRKVEHEGVAEMRQVEGQRLDRLQRAVWVNAVSGDLDAIKTTLGIMDRRAKLFGLNAPVALRVSEEITDVEFAEKMADLLGSIEPDALGELLRELPGGAGRALLNADGRTTATGDDAPPAHSRPSAGRREARTFRCNVRPGGRTFGERCREPLRDRQSQLLWLSRRALLA
ncbi:MAG: hypothetical protein WA988_19035 [Candidatus Nanopelagicales bacterium]